MLVPDNFIPPELVKEDYIARKLCASDVYLDYLAVMSSIDIIHKVRSESWPTTDLTIEDDLIDLSWHQREFEYKNSFAYTVMSKDENECYGCIYFYHPSFRFPDGLDKEYEVDVSWWCTQKMYENGFYERLSADVKEWVEKEWPFRHIYYSNRVQ
ncbi:MAG: GNAT family N-acetyltransferase [Candidatus Dojkabacteria bacterium]|nr:MAG: GNAT family N-acetyltransferase [Candidatus Dojkabacteria bacterium]